ncbi:hypothetical protein JG687_00016936 [Phytophthora cactorum]|uniref:Uncharacterized protein n=1 Tax=Phytophthora cactorum TaxID=29920 RepID=A0A329RW09_9STRA|nr:hypothetical protein PC112_g18037 [Phytophthora cactorum]KAG2811742.1 hypothetical protein PC111_g15107 [Phytophthora cactorum]KAG2851332.1 hypothetical protein PC113_g16003 [Phytophthora cactorum]KAG2900548.1 hypothetical protein PC115_g16164 [Phytophthora cactorum]KAG2971889.1 hypothetical protein PC118_g16017 [Phytophthora cactorum]
MDFCKAEGEELGVQVGVRTFGWESQRHHGRQLLHGEDELLDYYTAASKGPSAAAAHA